MMRALTGVVWIQVHSFTLNGQLFMTAAIHMLDLILVWIWVILPASSFRHL